MSFSKVVRIIKDNPKKSVAGLLVAGWLDSIWVRKWRYALFCIFPCSIHTTHALVHDKTLNHTLELAASGGRYWMRPRFSLSSFEMCH